MCVLQYGERDKTHSHGCSQLNNTHVCMSRYRVRDTAHSHGCSQQRNTMGMSLVMHPTP